MELEFLSCSLAKLFFLFFLCSSFSRPTKPKSKTNLRNKPTKTHGKRRKERRRIRTWNKPTNTHQTQIKNNPMNKSTKTYSRRRRKRRRRKRRRRTLTLGTNIQTPIAETIHINSKLISLAWSLHRRRCFSGLLLCYFYFFVIFVFVFFDLLRSLGKSSL